MKKPWMKMRRRAAIAGIAIPLAVAWVAGCGGKYDKPLEMPSKPRLGEYAYWDGYAGFEHANCLSIANGKMFVSYSEPSQALAFFSHADPIPTNVFLGFLGLTRPVKIGAGKYAIAVADSLETLTVRIYGLRGGDPIASFTDPDWRRISGLAMDDSGNVYVADAVKNFVRAYGPTGRKRFQVDLADSGFGIGHVMRPQSISYDGEALLIAEAHPEKFQVQRIRIDEPQKGIPFSAANPYISTFTDAEGNQLNLTKPVAVAATRQGSIFVVDRELGKIFKFDLAGNSIAIVNDVTAGGPSRLDDPLAMGTYNESDIVDNVYVLDQATGIIYQWKKE
ncbi:MAG: hypothetical protein V1694_01790 [Candidatus Eisenbacteria bacterium]